MKRNISLTLLLIMNLCLLLFTSCAPKPNISEYGELNYPQLKWMMTPQEVFEALGKNESDFQKAETGSDESLNRELSYTINEKMFGKNATIQFTFSPNADGNAMILTFVSVVFPEASEENYQSLVNQLEKELSQQKAEFQKDEYLKRIIQTDDGTESMQEMLPGGDVYEAEDAVGCEKSVRFSSVTQTTDLPETLQQDWEKGVEEFYQNHPTETPVQTLQPQSLSSATVSYTERKDDAAQSSLVVWFNGAGLCNVLKYTE